MKKLSALVVLALLALLPFAVLAEAPQLPRPGGIFDHPTEFLQEAVDFVLGPWVMGVGILLLVTCLIGWNLAPKEGFLGPAMRWAGTFIGMVFAGAIVVQIMGM